jgi:hypothetical protein
LASLWIGQLGQAIAVKDLEICQFGARFPLNLGNFGARLVGHGVPTRLFDAPLLEALKRDLISGLHPGFGHRPTVSSAIGADRIGWVTNKPRRPWHSV